MAKNLVIVESPAKAKTIEECATLFEIEVPKETIDKAFEDVYVQITKTANIPGFRTGKAPKELVRKHYSKEVKKEVINLVIPDAYQKAVGILQRIEKGELGTSAGTTIMDEVNRAAEEVKAYLAAEIAKAQGGKKQ